MTLSYQRLQKSQYKQPSLSLKSQNKKEIFPSSNDYMSEKNRSMILSLFGLSCLDRLVLSYIFFKIKSLTKPTEFFSLNIFEIQNSIIKYVSYRSVSITTINFEEIRKSIYILEKKKIIVSNAKEIAVSLSYYEFFKSLPVKNFLNEIPFLKDEQYVNKINSIFYLNRINSSTTKSSTTPNSTKKIDMENYVWEDLSDLTEGIFIEDQRPPLIGKLVKTEPEILKKETLDAEIFVEKNQPALLEKKEKQSSNQSLDALSEFDAINKRLDSFKLILNLINKSFESFKKEKKLIQEEILKNKTNNENIMAELKNVKESLNLLQKNNFNSEIQLFNKKLNHLNEKFTCFNDFVINIEQKKLDKLKEQAWKLHQQFLNAT